MLCLVPRFFQLRTDNSNRNGNRNGNGSAFVSDHGIDGSDGTDHGQSLNRSRRSFGVGRGPPPPSKQVGGGVNLPIRRSLCLCSSSSFAALPPSQVAAQAVGNPWTECFGRTLRRSSGRRGRKTRAPEADEQFVCVAFALRWRSNLKPEAHPPGVGRPG